MNRLSVLVAVLAAAFLVATLGVASFGQYAVCTNPAGSSFTVNDGDSYYDTLFQNDGSMTVNGGTMRAQSYLEMFSGSALVVNNGACVVNGGTIGGTGTMSTLVNKGACTIHGGSFTAYGAVIDNYSTCNVYGGYMFSSHAGMCNHGTLTVYDGTFRVNHCQVLDCAGNDSNVTVYGGSFITNDSVTSVTVEGGVLSIYGGDFSNGDLDRYEYSTSLGASGGVVNIHGGTFRSSVEQPLLGAYGGTINVYGYFSQYGELPTGIGSFSGTYADGTPVTMTYNNISGSINLLRPVPEPSSILGLLCGIGGVVGIRRNRRA